MRNASVKQHAGTHEVLSLRVLVSAFTALVVLTVVTVAAASAELGQWEIWVSLGIAALKGAIVVLYFMHLRHDKPLYSVILVLSLLMLALFLGLTLMDTAGYQTEIFETNQLSIQHEENLNVR